MSEACCKSGWSATAKSRPSALRQVLFYISCAQAHGIAQIGLVVEQAGDLLLRADIRNLLMACNNDMLGEKSLADIKDVLQHGRSVDGCQQLVDTEAAATPDARMMQAIVEYFTFIGLPHGFDYISLL